MDSPSHCSHPKDPPARGRTGSGRAERRSRWGRRLGGSVLLSAFVHLLLLVTLWNLPGPAAGRQAGSSEIDTAVRASAPELLGADRAEPTEDRASLVVALPAGAALRQLILSEYHRQEEQPATSEQAPEAWQELERLAARLQSLSTAAEVAEMARPILDSLSPPSLALSPAEERDPAEPPQGFDASSAHVRDVLMTTNDRGEPVVAAVMEDAAGRQIEAELDAETGEQLQRLFELMKRFPLLKTVYLELARPLVSQALAGAAGGSLPMETSVPVPADAGVP